MADLVLADSDVVSGTYTCTRCGFKLHFASTEQLPPCIACGNGEWHTVTGGSTSDAPRPAPSADIAGPSAGQ